MSSNLMETEPGGENSQYESIHTVTKPHSKQGGQPGTSQTENDASSEQRSQEQREHGARVAENIRYGQTISEQGVGGMTSNSEDTATTESGYGGTSTGGGTSDADGSRREQGYGPGSNVGA